MIKAFPEGDHVYLASIGEHARIGDLFAANGHLRDKWYHAPTITEIESGHPIGVEHGPIKSMEIDDEWTDIVRLFHAEGASDIVKSIEEAVEAWKRHHGKGHKTPPPPPPPLGDAVSGEMTFPSAS